MRNYQVEITGIAPLLMHSDNIDWADQMGRWKDDASNRGKGKPGDDRTPAWRWLGSTYNDGQRVAMPSDNIMRALMEGGAMVPVPGGKSGKTFKAQSQSGMVVLDGFLPLLVNGRELAWADLNALNGEDDFEVHQARTQALGFSLFVKRTKIGTSKHIRVRPRFDQWSLTGKIGVWDEKLTSNVLQQIFDYAGDYKGLCDWRPGGKTPGAFGRFKATVKKV